MAKPSPGPGPYQRRHLVRRVAQALACVLLLTALGALAAARAEPAAGARTSAGSAASDGAAPDAQAGGNQASRLRTRLGRREADAVERHIQSLHRALHITPAQEALWKPLAAAMRQNVVDLDSIYEQREKHYDEMSAVDNLRSYAAVQETHARNVSSLIGPFEALYESFSDAQKRIADETFRRLTDTAVRAGH